MYNWFCDAFVFRTQSVFPSNGFNYKGSYFKFRGEGSQIFWICFVGLSGKVPCDEVHGVTKDLNQHIGTQPQVHVSSILSS